MKKRIGLKLLLIVLCVFFAGCGQKEASEKVYLNIVYGNHSNSQKFKIGENATSLNQMLTAAIETQGNVAITVADGDPFQVFDEKIELANNFNWLSNNKKTQLVEDEIVKIQTILLSEAVNAKTEEVDILSAINIAIRSLKAAGNDGEKILVIMDSGISTCNPLNFAKSNLLGGEPETTADSIVAALKKSDSIPDLTGIKVTWIGMADVSSPQEELTDSNKKVLREIWRQILLAGGASVTFAEDLPETDKTADAGLPAVSTVSIQAEALVDIGNLSENEDVLPQINILTGDTIAFVESSYEYINEESAKDVLRKYAEFLINNRNEKKVLAGTTATVGTQEDCTIFSKGRAQTVADTLIEMGVSPDQLIVVGLGYQNIFHIPDLNAQGLLNENAAQNRSVVMMDIQTSEAQTIMSELNLN